MREVQHVHEPVDEAQAGRDEEVEGAESDAGDQGEDEHAHAEPSSPAARRRSLGVHAEQPPREVVVVEDLAGDAGVHDAPAADHDRAVGEPAHDLEVLLDEQDRDDLGRLEQRVGDLGDDLRREALGGLVDEQELVVVEERSRDRDHLLLTARERAGHLVAALHEIGEQRVDELAARIALPLGQREVLGDGQLREDLAVFGHVADAALDDAVGRQAVDALAGERDLAAAMDQTQDAAQRRGLAHAVAAEHRGDARRRHRERDVLDDLLPGDRAAQAPHLEDAASLMRAVPR